MRNLLLFFFILAGISCKGKTKTTAQTDSQPKQLVNDLARVLTEAQKRALEEKLVAFDNQTTNQVAVLFIDSLNGQPIEDLARQTFNRWGSGSKEKNNGVLLLFAMNDRKSRIEVGYGLENKLTNAHCGAILDTCIKPHFRNQEYYMGVEKAVNRIIELLSH